MADVKTISPQALQETCRSDSFRLIDVRTPMEFQEVHATGAINLPLETLDADSIKQQFDTSEQAPLYVICRSGSRGKQACHQLQAAGLEQVVNVEGGTLAWEAQGLPVVRGRKVMSLERQVRIAAGGLVAVASFLALLHHPYWAGISAFVGCGLVFAGVTDTCGMGMMLAKMPWNQVNNEQPTCSA